MNYSKMASYRGQQLTSTLLFTDLKGFSTISERLEPEALLLWLNEYLEVMTQLVQDHQGVINKFTGGWGDGGVWGPRRPYGSL